MRRPGSDGVIREAMAVVIAASRPQSRCLQPCGRWPYQGHQQPFTAVSQPSMPGSLERPRPGPRFPRRFAWPVWRVPNMRTCVREGCFVRRELCINTAIEGVFASASPDGCPSGRSPQKVPRGENWGRALGFSLLGQEPGTRSGEVPVDIISRETPSACEALPPTTIRSLAHGEPPISPGSMPEAGFYRLRAGSSATAAIHNRRPGRRGCGRRSYDSHAAVSATPWLPAVVAVVGVLLQPRSSAAVSQTQRPGAVSQPG